MNIEKYIKEGILLTWFLVVAKIIILFNHLLHDGDLSRSLTGANVDLAITCVFLHFMYKRYTIASLGMLVFFVCNQLIKMTDQPAYIIMLVMGMFIYARAIAACYNFNSGRNISLLFKVSNFVFFTLFVLLNIASVRLCYEGASSQTVRTGSSLNRIKTQFLLDKNVINDTNEIVYFYSPKEYIADGGLILTNKTLIIYNSVDVEGWFIVGIDYNEITNIEFEERIKNKARYKISIKDSIDRYIWLPSDLNQSEIVLNYIRNHREIQ